MSRPLTAEERIEARHLLQVLAENACTSRNAMEPATGVLVITDEAWYRQWDAMIQELEGFTERVRQNRPANPYRTGDRNVLQAQGADRVRDVRRGVPRLRADGLGGGLG